MNLKNPKHPDSAHPDSAHPDSAQRQISKHDAQLNSQIASPHALHLGNATRSGPMRVGIVGCGTAGSVAGAFLARRGWDVTVFERASPMQPTGAGLLIQPTGQHVLAHLGKLDWIRARATRVDRLLGVNTKGRAVLDVIYADLSPTLHGLGVARGTLFRACVDALQDSGGKVIEGATIQSIKPIGNCQSLLVARHSEVAHASTHIEQGPFDLVLVCDGARSALRPAHAQSRQYAWGAAWSLLPDPNGAFIGQLSQVYKGVSTMVGFLPVGREEPGGPELVAMFWSLPAREIDAFLAGNIMSLDAFKARVISLMPRAETSIESLKGWSQLLPARYVDACVVPAFLTHQATPLPTRGACVAYLGDAAHSMSPQLGQGANLALWDAWRLAELMPPCDVHSSQHTHETLSHILESWWRERKNHTRFYRVASRWLTPWFQGDIHAMAIARDTFMRPVSHLPWIHRQMLESLVGIKTGILSAMKLPN